jgi:drug/metabolite transporter superfamily protein YnfA
MFSSVRVRARVRLRVRLIWSHSCKLTALLLGAAAGLQGVFVIMSYGWGWLIDHDRPDVGDIVGSCLALAGVSICWFWPRKAAAS